MLLKMKKFCWANKNRSRKLLCHNYVQFIFNNRCTNCDIVQPKNKVIKLVRVVLIREILASDQGVRELKNVWLKKRITETTTSPHYLISINNCASCGCYEIKVSYR